MLQRPILRRIQWILCGLLVIVIFGPEALGVLFFPLALLLFIISFIVYSGRRRQRGKGGKIGQ